jgi:phytoene dehydrogenase-like protein
MRGVVSGTLPWWGTIFNATDPSQAPDGQDVIYIYAPMVPASPVGGWEAHRAETAEQLVNQAAQILSTTLRQHELGRFVETPADRADRIGTRNGCLYHIDMQTTRVGPFRPALGLGTYETPIRQLYLSGVGTHPPAGVSGLNGLRTAETVLRDVGISGAQAGAHQSPAGASVLSRGRSAREAIVARVLAQMER